MSELRRANRPHGDAPSNGPLDGRYRQTAGLERARIRGLAGSGAVIVVRGPAGIGQSALIDAAVDPAVARGAIQIVANALALSDDAIRPPADLATAAAVATDVRVVRSGGHPRSSGEVLAMMFDAGFPEAHEVPGSWPAPVRPDHRRRPSPLSGGALRIERVEVLDGGWGPGRRNASSASTTTGDRTASRSSPTGSSTGRSCPPTTPDQYAVDVYFG